MRLQLWESWLRRFYSWVRLASNFPDRYLMFGIAVQHCSPFCRGWGFGAFLWIYDLTCWLSQFISYLLFLQRAYMTSYLITWRSCFQNLDIYREWTILAVLIAAWAICLQSVLTISVRLYTCRSVLICIRGAAVCCQIAGTRGPPYQKYPSRHEAHRIRKTILTDPLPLIYNLMKLALYSGMIVIHLSAALRWS